MPRQPHEKRRIRVVRRWSKLPHDHTGIEVDAYLVGGTEGVFAAWREGDMIHFATGDDGYWREVASYHSDWATNIILCIGFAHANTP